MIIDPSDMPPKDDEINHLPKTELELIPEISLHAIAGTDHPQTLRVIGMLQARKVAVLIDGGSTYNFIDQTLAMKLGLKVSRQEKIQVVVANKEKIECAGLCKGLTIVIQGCPTVADFYVLPVAACPMVLGIQWLATLGPVETDYAQLTMTFKLHNQFYSFKGMRNHGLGFLTDKESSQGPEGYGTAFLIQILSTESSSTNTPYPPDLNQLLSNFSLVFQPPTTLPPKQPHDHIIPLLPNTPPINVRPYRYPHYKKSEIEKIVREMLQTGLIRPSNSPFSSPVLLVRKASGEWRFCIDYRALNTMTIKDKYPIPVIDELLDELYGAHYFSKLDLRSGYHQIRVQEEDIPKTAFRTHEGHYEFVVMPFGLTNAPTTFQSLMNDIFRPHLRKFALVFFDDILIYSKSWEEHLSHLQTVLTILAANHLFTKEAKCRFGVTSVDYLGHIISADGVSVDPSKIQAIEEWPIPTTHMEVRGFLGLAGYYRKFVQHFGKIVAPLHQLLTLDTLEWTDSTQDAFLNLKRALTTTPVLGLPNFTQPFVVECDACGTGIGAVLQQHGRPLAYFIQHLKGSALSLSTYEKEMLAIVKFVRHWRPYLLGRTFRVRTDQRSLKYLMDKRITTPAQGRWLPKLLGYDYKIEYKPGLANQAADSLSRKAELAFLSVSQPQENWWADLQRECAEDPFYGFLASLPHFVHRDGIWFLHGKVYLNPMSPLIPTLIAECHATPTRWSFWFPQNSSSPS